MIPVFIDGPLAQEETLLVMENGTSLGGGPKGLRGALRAVGKPELH